MLQRLKGAIDSRLAEEQARQRAAVQSASPSRSGSTSARASLSRNLSPSKAPKQTGGNAPDPREFDPDCGSGGEGSMILAQEGQLLEHTSGRKERAKEEPLASMSDPKKPAENGDDQRPAELPTDVRVKLRKLERLEGKYQELLTAYRIAHAKIQAIEPFEASLRENTPLTSINDPNALLEYLNQVTLKSDMVLDELKRVSAERDDYHKRLDDTAKQVHGLEAEALKLSKVQDAKSPAQTQGPAMQSANLSNSKPTESSSLVGPEVPVKSRNQLTTSRIPGISLFSAKSNAIVRPQEEIETPEEFFSYDHELLLLEAELQERQTEIVDLKMQVSTLEREISTARESTSEMAQSMENASQELQALREKSAKHEQAERELHKTVEEMRQANLSVSAIHQDPTRGDRIPETNVMQLPATLRERGSTDPQSLVVPDEAQVRFAALEKSFADLEDELAQKNATVKNLEDSLAMSQLAERQQAHQVHGESASQKEIDVLNHAVETLRSQLQAADAKIEELKEAKELVESEIETALEHKGHHAMQAEERGKLTGEGVDGFEDHLPELPSTKYFGFVNDDGSVILGNTPDAYRRLSVIIKDKRPALYDALITLDKSNTEPDETLETSVVSYDNLKKAKRKKKKNKGGKGSMAEHRTHEPPAKVTETLVEPGSVVQELFPPSPTTMHGLDNHIKVLEHEVQVKGATIDRLSAKLKDQEALLEEIETLRDDLLHQGQEHVEAQDTLKTTKIERSAFEACLAVAEAEVLDAKAYSTAESMKSQETTNKLVSDFEDLKLKTDTFERELSAATELAAARFKEIRDLRELISKAQPELRDLRSEVENLRPMKQDLQNKVVELARVESRYEDLKLDMKNLGKKVGEKDTALKNLRQKLADAIGAKEMAEEQLQSVRTDLRNGELARNSASDVHRETLEELSRAKASFDVSQSKLYEMEQGIRVHLQEIANLREEINLKTSLHESSQTILFSLREQIQELSTQGREATSRAECLEEELAEVQRMLSERSREAETMRSLLANAEGRTSAKLREMKERMETALEERDRVEDEASTTNRRMAREVEDLRDKTREATRSVKAVEDEKDELGRSLRSLKLSRDEMEATEHRARAEAVEAQATVQQLRQALDQREREGREAERLRLENKRALDEAQESLGQLQSINKGLTEELKSLSSQRKRSMRPTARAESENQFPRSSLDSASPNDLGNTVEGSPAPKNRDRLPASRSSTPSGPNPPTIDYVYLKNVLLQFLEQKEKSHQKQLIPVLGMLLNFDRKDEQRWMAAITAR